MVLDFPAGNIFESFLMYSTLKFLFYFMRVGLIYLKRLPILAFPYGNTRAQAKGRCEELQKPKVNIASLGMNICTLDSRKRTASL
jgi:hypothetical protein